MIPRNAPSSPNTTMRAALTTLSVVFSRTVPTTRSTVSASSGAQFGSVNGLPGMREPTIAGSGQGRFGDDLARVGVDRDRPVVARRRCRSPPTGRGTCRSRRTCRCRRTSSSRHGRARTSRLVPFSTAALASAATAPRSSGVCITASGVGVGSDFRCVGRGLRRGRGFRRRLARRSAPASESRRRSARRVVCSRCSLGVAGRGRLFRCSADVSKSASPAAAVSAGASIATELVGVVAAAAGLGTTTPSAATATRARRGAEPARVRAAPFERPDV